MDLGNMSNGRDLDDLRAERNARMNPPEFEVGQGSDSDWGDIFSDDGGGSSMNSDAFSGSSDLGGGGDAFSNSGSMMGGGAFQQPMSQPATSSTEDKIFDALAVGAKASVKGGKTLVEGMHLGLKDNTSKYWAYFGVKVMKTGLVVSGVSVCLCLLSAFSGMLHNTLWFLIGGLLSTASGIGITTFNYGKLQTNQDISEPVTDTPIINTSSDMESESTESDNSSFPSDIPEDEDDSSDDSWGDWGTPSEDDSEVADDVPEDDSSDGWGDWGSVDLSEPEPTSTSDNFSSNTVEEAIENIQQIPAHTQTRQYLFEQAMKVLPKMSPDFSSMKSIYDTEDAFLIFDDILRKASKQCGSKELPELLELRENLSIIQLKSTRPKGLKEEAVATEVARMYSMDDYGKVIHKGVYATSVAVGDYFIINIFTGNNPLVSLADIYTIIKDQVLDTSKSMPMVFGFNEFGEPIFADAGNIFSYIVAGKPRSGKSWKAQSIVLQLCLFNSPKEITFEVFDVKNETSDFKSISESLPHFKSFYSDRAAIIKRLRYLTTVEAERRRAILKKYNAIAIKDLKEAHPDVDLPYLYIIIDEMLGLRRGFTKEEDSEFVGILESFVTLFPNLGFRVLLIPHRMVNDICPKTVYSNVNCKMCVKASFEDMKSALNITQKSFPYSLPNTGDMALNADVINEGAVTYCHGEAITKSNDDNTAIFKYVGALWNLLEPEESKSDNGVKNISKEEKPKHQFVGHSVEELEPALNQISEDPEDEDFIDIFGDEDSDVDESYWDSL